MPGTAPGTQQALDKAQNANKVQSKTHSQSWEVGGGKQETSPQGREENALRGKQAQVQGQTFPV